MTGENDPRIEEARAVLLVDLIDALGIDGLKRAGRELVGPCPRPGCGGDDRFSINPQKNVFNCRICKGSGDAIALVQMVRGLEFMPAVEYLAGERKTVSDDELRKRKEQRDRDAKRREDEAEKFRQSHVRMARDIWAAGIAPEGTAVRSYLELRGFTRERLPVLPRCLRFHPDLPYMVQDGREWREAHRGPAMLAVIATPAGEGSAVHRTWIDLDRPKGKASIVYNGREFAAKTVLGSKRGGAIRLFTPKAEARSRPLTLYMGEGIETTLTAAIAGDPGACYWAGVDLDNMTGRIVRGEGMLYAGRPDLTDDRAFVPPAGIERLVYIQDGDSHAKLTYAKLTAGIRRAMIRRPGLTGQIVKIEGKDLNDLLIEERQGESSPAEDGR